MLAGLSFLRWAEMYKDRIRAARAYAHLSQIELARMVDMHQIAISQLVRATALHLHTPQQKRELVE